VILSVKNHNTKYNKTKQNTEEKQKQNKLSNKNKKSITLGD
jgi:hypothetical protein